MERCVRFFFDLEFVDGATLVVEDLNVDVVAIFLKAGHDAVGCGKVVAIVVGLEGLD